jgi:thiol-disulfide isomerase/thioredoxin
MKKILFNHNNQRYQRSIMTINLNFAINWMKAIATKFKLFTIYFLFFAFHFSNLSYAQTLSGKIDHFYNKPFTLSVHIGDSLIPVQKITTNEKGEFQFDLQNLNNVYATLGKKYGLPKHAMLRIELNRERNQFADVIVQSFYEPIISINKEIKTRGDNRDIRIHLVYNPSLWFNFAADSAEVKTSDINKSLYQFQKQWRKVQVAEGWLLEMSRLFPYADEFSKTLINEYYKRYKKMDALMKEHLKHPKNPESKIALAYYRPVVPDYGMPDGDRFKIFRQHFWDYFDPNDSLFLFTPVLIDKFEEWVYLHHHHKDSIAGLYLDRSDIIQGINSFIEKINKNQQNRDAVLEYVLKKLDGDKDDKRLFMEVYDHWLKPQTGDCELENPKWQKYHEKAAVYRNVIIGAQAIDFEIMPGRLSLYDIPSDYTLIVFWASWCPHCTQEMPRLKAVLEDISQNKKISLSVVMVSLDTNNTAWTTYVNEQGLQNYIHLCDYKGWKGEIVKLYNVFATPMMYLLDRNKTIIAKPLFSEQLYKYLVK